MRNLFYVTLLFLFSTINFSSDDISRYVLSPQTVVHVIKCDTIHVVKEVPTFSPYFKSSEDIILFVRYIKTQSGRLDMDNWAVIKTMMNRLERKQVSFREYYGHQSINNSNSILRMKRGTLKIGFSWEEPKDVKIYERVVQALLGNYPKEIDKKIGKDVLFFESFPKTWNLKPKGCFDRNKIVASYRHEFYKR